VTITMKTGVKKDGTMVARQCKAFLDGGAYCSLGPLTRFWWALSDPSLPLPTTITMVTGFTPISLPAGP